MINPVMHPDSQVDLALLGRFERGLNVRWPEKSQEEKEGTTYAGR